MKKTTELVKSPHMKNDLKIGLKVKITLVFVFALQSIVFSNQGNEVNTSKNTLQQEQIQFSVTGTVSESNGDPLIGANITIKGTQTGTVSDMDGKFAITVNKGDILVISFIGFLEEEIEITKDQNLDVLLQLSTAELDEIMVIGYGTVKKSDATGSVSSISSEEVAQVPAGSIVGALKGRASGVIVNQASGQPGQPLQIRIRGNNSISGGNDPLYVVDGLPLNDFGSDINPEDIASIEILKDASSTAIYGSRGANGVVMITTKRGSTDQLKVSYHGYHGVQKLRKKIDLIGRDDFVKLSNLIYDEAVVAYNNDNTLPVPVVPVFEDGVDNDWQDLVYRNAIMKNHQISVSNGNDVVKYYASFNYLDQEGIINNSGFSRYSFRLNGDVKISDRLTLRNNISINWSEFNQAFDEWADGFGAIPYTTLVMPPTTPILDSDGNYTSFVGTSWGGTNPIGISKNDLDTRLNTRVIGNIDLTYTIAEGLFVKSSIGLTTLNSKTSSYLSRGIASFGPTDGQATTTIGNNVSLINENIIGYSKETGKHSVNLTAGITYESNKADMLTVNGTGFVSDIFENNLIQAASNMGIPQSDLFGSTMVSYLARANYQYNNKYLLTITGRYDGSSKFGDNNEYAFFPSAAFAWKLINEDFLSLPESFSDLKLRVSSGKSGNQAIAPYQTLARLANSTSILDNEAMTGFILSGMSNPDLKWETTTSSNIGVDVGMFQNRLTFSADYYVKQTTDLLFDAILPPSSGFTSSTRNVGEMENKGFEFECAGIISSSDLKWKSTFNIDFNRNKVISLGTDGLGNKIERINAPGAGGNWFPLFINEPGRQYYGYNVLGIYETDQEAIDNGEPNKTAGDYKIENVDGGAIGDGDKQILTNLQPDFTFGFNNEFSYKGFDLTVLIVGSYGNDIVNEFHKYYTALTGLWNVTQDAWDNRWTPQNTGGTYAKVTSNAFGTIVGGGPMSIMVEDGSYLKFRDIKLGYTIPKNITDKANISRIKIYASGQNLITLTNYRHYDPEANWENAGVQGWDRGVYPSTKSVIFGVLADF